ncbi:MAG: GspH/FimT family pseudopilin [Gammaproteobacteria bacterium]|nr:GspH/FimT family pseudopilin [Gammaproteobacteria bacterium]
MKKRRSAGFTILELMITIAVAAVLLVVAVPNMMALVRNNRLVTAANTFVGDLNLARSEGIKRARDVFLTANAPTADNEYGGGWTVWVDDNNDGAMTADEQLRVTPGIRADMTLDSTNDITQVQYQRNGSLNGAATLIFDLCDDRTGETGRQISITVVGRVSTDNQFVCP